MGVFLEICAQALSDIEGHGSTNDESAESKWLETVATGAIALPIAEDLKSQVQALAEDEWMAITQADFSPKTALRDFFIELRTLLEPEQMTVLLHALCQENPELVPVNFMTPRQRNNRLKKVTRSFVGLLGLH